MRMHDVVADLVRRYAPDVAVSSVEPLGAGQENKAFLVNGDLVVRVRNDDADGIDIATEVAVLARLAIVSPLPVPEVMFVDDAASAFAYRLLRGSPLLGAEQPPAYAIAPALGGFLSRIHGDGELAGLVPDDVQPLWGWRDDADRDFRTVRSSLEPSLARRVEQFLANHVPPEPPSLTFCHNDLGSEHLLVADGVLTGVIDWSDAAVTDPAYDWGLVLRDLGPAVLDAGLRHYERPFADADRERALFYARCAWLEDFAYGVPRYVAAALTHSANVFGD
jgi:aminoglycoside phosphotransferase (APT) family kinase protein